MKMKRRVHIEFHTRQRFTVTTFAGQRLFDFKEIADKSHVKMYLDLISLKVVTGTQVQEYDSGFIASRNGDNLSIHYRSVGGNGWERVGSCGLKFFLWRYTSTDNVEEEVNEGTFSCTIVE